MHETEVRLGRAALKSWKAQLAQKKVFLEVYKASGNRPAADMVRDGIFYLEGNIKMMQEALRHLDPKPKRKLRRKKRGGK
jgi:hypothetical protein